MQKNYIYNNYYLAGKQIKQLLTGNELLKAKKGTKVYPRLYYITSDLLRFVWNSKRKTQAKSQSKQYIIISIIIIVIINSLYMEFMEIQIDMFFIIPFSYSQD